MHSASFVAHTAVDDAGDHTTALPDASAGAISPATRSMAAARSNADRAAQSREAAFAAAIARRASSRVPSGTVPSDSPVAGLVASMRAPDSDSLQAPPTTNR